MLDAGALVEVDVLLDLGLLAAFSGLVDRELDAPVSIAHHLGHQGGIVGGNVLVVEGDQLGEAHDLGVELAPGVHLAPADVADHVVDVFEADGRCRALGVPCLVARQEHAVVGLSLHEDVDGVSIGLDAAEDHLAIAILAGVRLECAHGAAGGGLLPALLRVVHPQGHGLHAVAVPIEVVVERTVRHERRGQDERDLVLAQHVADAVVATGFQPLVGERLIAPGVHVVVRALLGVADNQFDVVGAEEGQEVVRFGDDDFGLGGLLFHGHCRVQSRVFGV